MDAIARSRVENVGELELRDYLNRWMRPGVERVIAAASGPATATPGVRIVLTRVRTSAKCCTRKTIFVVSPRRSSCVCGSCGVSQAPR